MPAAVEAISLGHKKPMNLSFRIPVLLYKLGVFLMPHSAHRYELEKKIDINLQPFCLKYNVREVGSKME